MKKAWLASLAGWLLSAGLTYAQDVIGPLSEAPPAGNRAYFRGEYLLWWMKKAPNQVPLLTTGDPFNDPAAGIIGSPSTRVVFGGDDIGLNNFSGARFTLGTWLNAEQTLALEGSGFFLAQNSANFALNSGGSPFLAVPFVGPNGPGRLILANQGDLGPVLNAVDPRQAAGAFNVWTTSQLWGAEVNSLFRVANGRNTSLDLLTGFNYRGLAEGLTLNYAATVDAAGAGPFAVTARDRFSTHNDFYGAQLGARAGWRADRLSLDVTGKVAFGDTHQFANVEGASTFRGTGTATAFGASLASPQGIFAQPSNLGARRHDVFGVVPEVTVQGGYQILPGARVLVGYNFMYWSRVLRPGNQIDRTINTNAGADFIGGLQTDVPNQGGRPAPRLSQSDFWAQGINLGLEFRY